MYMCAWVHVTGKAIEWANDRNCVHRIRWWAIEAPHHTHQPPCGRLYAAEVCFQYESRTKNAQVGDSLQKFAWNHLELACGASIMDGSLPWNTQYWMKRQQMLNQPYCLFVTVLQLQRSTWSAYVYVCVRVSLQISLTECHTRSGSVWN